MLKVQYETNHQWSKIQVDAHINSKEIEARYFTPSKTIDEFVCVSCWDMESKEKVQLFISGPALDVFIEKMSTICALRFKNKGDSCQ